MTVLDQSTQRPPVVASLGCGTLVVIALIVLIFSSGSSMQPLQDEISGLRTEIAGLRVEVEALREELRTTGTRTTESTPPAE